ncbi:unknown function [Vibrio phage D479]
MKTIVIDVDGVLLDWKANIPFYMIQLGMLSKLNPDWRNYHDADASGLFINSDTYEVGKLIAGYAEHDSSKYLPAYPDAYSAVGKLSRAYRLVVLSKFGQGRVAWFNRQHNLNALFPGMFDQVFCIEYYEKKSNWMRIISDTYDVEYFVDDSLDNVRDIEEHYPDIKCLHVDRKADPVNAFTNAIQSLTNP